MENLVEQNTLEAKNKEIIVNGMTKGAATLNPDVLDDYIDDNYIQHNPMIRQGKAGLKAFMQAMIAAGAQPQKIEIVNASASGDLVWIHCKMYLAGKYMSIADIFKMKNGKAIEHWDVMQEIPKATA